MITERKYLPVAAADWSEYAAGTKPFAVSFIEQSDIVQKVTSIAKEMQIVFEGNSSHDDKLMLGSVKQPKACIVQLSQIVNAIKTVSAALSGRATNSLNADAIAVVDQGLGQYIMNCELICLRVDVVLQKLRLLAPEMASLTALLNPSVEIPGVFFEQILGIQLTDISSKELLERLLLNAQIGTVKDLIEAFKNRECEGQNFLALLDEHIKSYIKKTCDKMPEDLKEIFDEKWGGQSVGAVYYDQRVFHRQPSFYTHQAIDPQDLIALSKFESEVKEYKGSNKLVPTSQLYRGQKGDYYLHIRCMNGTQNLIKSLKAYDNFLWSPDGHSFYQMEDCGAATVNDAYEVKVVTQQESSDKRIQLRANDLFVSVFGVNLNAKADKIAEYERLGLQELENVLNKLIGQDQVVPFKIALKPEYLLQKSDGDYLYIEGAYTDDRNEHYVHIQNGGKWSKFQVTQFERFRDGGTTNIYFNNGTSNHTSCIHVPAPNKRDEEPSFRDGPDHRYQLKKLDQCTFDYDSIGITPEESNERVAMDNLYRI